MMHAPSLINRVVSTTRDDISQSGGKPANKPLTAAQQTIVDHRRILEAAVAILAQGEELLAGLSDETYSRRVPAAFNASIGGHFRHCLDHFTSFLRSLDADVVDYDHRERDVLIETDRTVALESARKIRLSLEQLPPALLDQGVGARCEVHYVEGDSPVTRSSLGRELVYGIAHAIHHYALISVMAKLMEVAVPPQFGVAPSTLAYQHGQLHK
jgi:uncharacterized damage-inducible protein DinB